MTVAGGDRVAVILLRRKDILDGSCVCIPLPPSGDGCVHCVPRGQTCTLELEAKIGNLFACDPPSTSNHGASLLPLLRVVFLRTAAAGVLLSEIQYCSETRSIAIDGGGGSGSAVSRDASQPRWRLDAQVLATLRADPSSRDADWVLVMLDFLACGDFGGDGLGNASDCGGACVRGACRGDDGGDVGVGSDARCSASCVALRANCGADPGPDPRRAHETWDAGHVRDACCDGGGVVERESGYWRGESVEEDVMRCQPYGEASEDGARAAVYRGRAT